MNFVHPCKSLTCSSGQDDPWAPYHIRPLRAAFEAATVDKVSARSMTLKNSPTSKSSPDLRIEVSSALCLLFASSLRRIQCTTVSYPGTPVTKSVVSAKGSPYRCLSPEHMPKRHSRRNVLLQRPGHQTYRSCAYALTSKHVTPFSQPKTCQRWNVQFISSSIWLPVEQ